MIPQSNEIRFEVTTKCNYNCIICPREQLTRPKETMDLETFTFLFDKIKSETGQYDTLTFPGMGEPLLDDTLDDKILHARKRNFAVLLLTNASLLTVERFKRLQDIGLTSVRVSLYGDSQESYNAVHGVKDPDLFLRIKENLTRIAELRTSTQLLLTYNVVAQTNEANLETWIAYWKDKVDLLEVWRPHNWVDAKTYRAVKPEKLNTCGRPWKTPLQVQVDGTVNMCCFDFDGKLLLGDLRKQSLQEIFSSPMYRKIEACHTSGDYAGSGLICEHCDQRNKDKSDVMVFNSKFDIKDRVGKVSTTYRDLK